MTRTSRILLTTALLSVAYGVLLWLVVWMFPDLIG